MKKNTIILLGALLLSIGIFQFSSNKEGIQEKELATKVENQLLALGNALDNKELQNAIILQSYAEQLKSLKPELASVADKMAKDTQSDGPAMLRMKQQLEAIRNNPATIGNGSKQDVMAALSALARSSTIEGYNLYLLNDVNVIASLSGGKLSAIAPPAGSQQGAEGAVGELVGNPEYGQWKQQNGMSVWEWYGAYAIFRDLVGGGRPFYYNDWRARQSGGYNSFYNNSYDSNKMKAVNDNNRQQKTYGSGQNRRSSSYFSGSSSRSGASSSRRSSSYGKR